MKTGMKVVRKMVVMDSCGGGGGGGDGGGGPGNETIPLHLHE